MDTFPKIIWQTHKWDYDSLPNIYKKTSATWRLMNPDWEYIYVPNHKIRDKIIETNDDDLLRFFDQQETWMSKADVYREIMVYYYGGLWADMDSVCLFPIEKVIERNKDKEMICLPAIHKFGFNPEKNYEVEGTNEGINRLLKKEDIGYWVSNAVFVGKQKNKISLEIILSMKESWKFKETSFMGTRYELYQKNHEMVSLDLLCGLHDKRFNERENLD